MTSGEGGRADRVSTSTAPLLRSRPGCFIALGLACGTAFFAHDLPRKFRGDSQLAVAPQPVYLRCRKEELDLGRCYEEACLPPGRDEQGEGRARKVPSDSRRLKAVQIILAHTEMLGSHPEGGGGPPLHHYKRLKVEIANDSVPYAEETRRNHDQDNRDHRRRHNLGSGRGHQRLLSDTAHQAAAGRDRQSGILNFPDG